MVAKTERIINQWTAIGIVLVAVGVPMMFGVMVAALGSKYESSCSAVKGEEPVCTTHYQYGGVDIPEINVQVIGGFLGAIAAGYLAVKKGKLPEPLQEIAEDFLGGEDDLSRPG